MIRFLYIVNKQGLVRFIRYFEHGELKERNQLQSEIIRSVMERNEKQNELAVLEIMQNILETLDLYFQKVSEIDIVFNLERVHMILDEMIVSGYPAETCKVRALVPLQLLDANKK